MKEATAWAIVSGDEIRSNADQLDIYGSEQTASWARDYLRRYEKVPGGVKIVKVSIRLDPNKQHA